MKIIVMNRAQAETTVVQGRCAYISLHDSDQTPASLPTTEECQGILRIGTDDVLDGADQGRPIVVFDHTHARQVLDFVQTMIDNIDTLVVHCNGGQCRSPAIAAALSKIMLGDDDVWFRTKRPNMKVYREILELYFSEN